MSRKLSFVSCILLILLLSTWVAGQQIGTSLAENHPKLITQRCAKGSGCSENPRSIVLDANWRWLHTTSGYTNCYTGSSWNRDICSDPESCTAKCALDGADYPTTYGITTNNDELTLKFVTKHAYGTNVGSRVYLMDSSDSNYEMFYLKNQEFSFDVDVSNLPCGINGALYFVEMEKDGGSSNPNNKAGAKYGTGYCDAQCPHDIKYIKGQANLLDWDEKKKVGRWGSCCNEMDIWEANSIASAYTPHPCNVTGLHRCEGGNCNVCDQPGCDFNSYRLGDRDFFGENKIVDTKQKFTVITQFHTSDNTTRGDLVEIRRIYIQNGRVIQNSKVNVPGMNQYDSITNKFCDSQKDVFQDKNDFKNKGGLKAVGRSLDRGHVLVMSLWDDSNVNMLWLDSNFPLDRPATQPGVARGTCPISSGKPEEVERDYPNAYVKFSKVRVGDIGSTVL
ncbi:exoglucanase [Acrasis kona]|uniref:cellulase n=1 Tax=Acrasis kona TaxID=1008807 RepID=A0AAW2YKA0_9EUKA